MLEEDFETDGDEDKAAEGLDFIFEEVTDSGADENSEIREEESDKTDEQNGRKEGGGEEGEGYSDSEGIDAGGNGENKKDGDFCGVEIYRFGFEFGGFVNHFDSDGKEETEGYPVVVGFDVFSDKQGRGEADEGHKGLEETEEGGHTEGAEGF